MTPVLPVIAPVRPRVRDETIEQPRLLEEVVEEYREEHPTGVVWLTGSAGVGKSTALAHLAARFQDDIRFNFFDEFDTNKIGQLAGHCLVVVAGPRSIPRDRPQLRLEPWREDELVEYLLAKHHGQCNQVMQQLGAAVRRSWLPEIACIFLDQLAASPSTTDIHDALKDFIQSKLGHKSQIDAARKLCLAYQRGGGKALLALPASDVQSLPQSVRRLLRHDIVQLPLAAEQIVQTIIAGSAARILDQPLSPSLVQAVAGQLDGDKKSLRKLRKILNSERHSECHPMVASILYAHGNAWRPPGKNLMTWRFARAYFPKASWDEIDLEGADLKGVDFSGANLNAASLDHAVLSEAVLSDAALNGASLNGISAIGARFDNAAMRKAQLFQALLIKASYVSTNLSNASLMKANLRRADFSYASLEEANVSSARLTGAILDGTNLRQCNLSSVIAKQVDFRTALLDGARAKQARLAAANFEEVTWPGADLEGAKLGNAHLTGSILHGANLRDANLSEAGLGEIDWENADLRNANLQGATFHMGSSRSGLVDSFIASEGTRTGFYTDDLEKLYFKSPEEVRKANLRGADLRGANLTDVDFYLVDLRDAKLDQDQRRQAAASGAILADENC